MHARLRRKTELLLSILAAALLSGAAPPAGSQPDSAPAPSAAAAGSSSTHRFPWREAGWSEREAAAHLLDRLTFGPRPGEVDRVVAMGLERWLETQLGPPLPEPRLEAELQKLPALGMSLEQILNTYPPQVVVRRIARNEGILKEEDLPQEGGANRSPESREAMARYRRWSEEQGWRSDRELVAQTQAQKLLRVVYSENQLREVLADFWFNHFYVGLTDNAVRQYLLAYERDAIRPHVLGSFRTMLEATAKHPAMLLYLDNAESTANPGQPTLAPAFDPGAVERFGMGAGMRGGAGRGPRGGMGGGRGRPGGGMRGGGMGGGMRRMETMGQEMPQVRPENRRRRGLNENYARELLELHTLGVDGGYTQQDVIEVARALTGWTVYRLGPGMERMGRVREEEGAARKAARRDRMAAGSEGGRRRGRLEGPGSDPKNGFQFLPMVHDAGEKTILGKKFPKSRGIEEGLEVLDLLAAHPSTARHLARKFATRFVADEPPQSLVDRLAERFRATRGDLRQLVWALVESPEFWAKEARGQKVKSPLEYAASALRALDAQVDNPFPTLQWLERMGQPLYRYGAPTGFPDRADFWVSAGNMMARMNFGLELATGRLPGVRWTLKTLTAGREPESPAHALEVLGGQAMPARALGSTVEKLLPLVLEPGLAERVAAQDPSGEPRESGPSMAEQAMGASGMEPGTERPRPPQGARDRFRFEGPPFFARAVAMKSPGEPASTLELALGVLVGSPEFQRR